MPLFYHGLALYQQLLLALPNTGDSNAGKMGIIFAVFVIALILIIVLMVTGKKKKK